LGDCGRANEKKSIVKETIEGKWIIVLGHLTKAARARSESVGYKINYGTEKEKISGAR